MPWPCPRSGWTHAESLHTCTGGSHDRTDFLPLKHGLAIMALGAMAANPECKVKIVPVGVGNISLARLVPPIVV